MTARRATGTKKAGSGDSGRGQDGSAGGRALTQQIRILTAKLKAGLQGLYGPRLLGVYLFGSYARGKEDPESDLDVLVVLDQVDRYWDEIIRTGGMASGISLEFGVTVSLVFAGDNDWRTGASSFLVNVREEAVAA